MALCGGYEASARFYDLFDRKRNVPFFRRYAHPVGRALDVGAGTGRIALPLAREGVHLHCIEPSPAMRAQFEHKLERDPDLKERITLIAATAATFDCGCTFPLCILSGTFDHFLDDDERKAALENIARHLDPGGQVVLDVYLGLMTGTPLQEAGDVRVGSRRIRRFVGGRILPNGRKETRLVYEVHEAGVLVDRIEEVSLVGVVDRVQILRLLGKVGFDVRREWGSFDFTPYADGDSLLIIEATRK